MSTFSVYYFPSETDDSIYFEEVRHVSAEVAAEKFKFLTTGVAARVGLIQRVIITDSLDCTVAEWIRGKGRTWPKDTPDK